MKFRHSGGESEKIEAQMAPMIDVVFLLLIFFMLTLRLVEPEGDFNINMPISAPSEARPDDPQLPDIKVRLVADENGQLVRLMLGQRTLGSGSAAFERLNDRILQLIGGRAGNPRLKDVEVEIDADYRLHYEYTVRAISACRGRYDEATKQIIPYVETIKFAPPRRPQGSGT